MPKFYGAIDLVKNELQNAVVQNLGSAPSSPVKGQIYFDSTANIFYWYNGTVWVAAQSGGSLTPASTVTTSAVGDAAVVGTATNYAREDHKHGREAFGAITPETTFGTSGANGVATTLARSDHTHGNPVHDGAAHSAISLSALAVPTADLNLNGKKITSLAVPTIGTDAATKAYVDSSIYGLTWKTPVRCASTANLSLTGAATVDGIAIQTGDRVLVKNQTTPSQNGIYMASTAGAWTRDNDSDAWTELIDAAVFVSVGTTQADTSWVCTVDAGGTIGTTNVTWVQFGSAANYLGGNGLTLTGNTFDVVAGDTSLTVSADSMIVNTAVIATVASAASKLTPTAAQTTNYSVLAGQLAVMDVTSGNLIVTLPSAPPDGTEVGAVIKSTGANMLTVSRGAGDTIAGAISVFLRGQGSSVRLRYQSSTLTWWPAVAPNPNQTPLSEFAQPLNTVTFGNQKITGLADATTATDAMNQQSSDARYPLKSLLTAKGGLYVASASGVIAYQAVGTDGQVLTADSAQANGVKWATPAVTGTQKYSTTLAGNVAYATGEVVTHNLNTRDIHVAVYNGATPYAAVEVDWEATTVNTVTVRYNPALGAGYRVVVIG